MEHCLIKVTAVIFILVFARATLAAPPEMTSKKPCGLDINPHMHKMVSDEYAAKLTDNPIGGKQEHQIKASIQSATSECNEPSSIESDEHVDASTSQACGFGITSTAGSFASKLKFGKTYKFNGGQVKICCNNVGAIAGLRQKKELNSLGNLLLPTAGHWRDNGLGYNELSSKNGLGEDFKLISFEPIDILQDNTPLGRCYCKTRQLRNGEVVKFESLFDSNCTAHIVLSPSGEKYIRMLHGTALGSIESLHTYGIQPIGRGDLGDGFYMTSSFKVAMGYGQNKCTIAEVIAKLPEFAKKLIEGEGGEMIIDKPKPVMVMSVLVPYGMDVKKYGTVAPGSKVYIEQHYNSVLLNKFIFRQAILSRLKPEKGYIRRNDKFQMKIPPRQCFHK
jgi:hypothetical protein